MFSFCFSLGVWFGGGFLYSTSAVSRKNIILRYQYPSGRNWYKLRRYLFRHSSFLCFFFFLLRFFGSSSSLVLLLLKTPNVIQPIARNANPSPGTIARGRSSATSTSLGRNAKEYP